MVLMQLPKTPYTLSQAIAREEGFYVDGSRAQRNNNPGNIEYGSFAISTGATGSDGRFAIYPTPEAGFSSLVGLLLRHYLGMTIAQAINHWAPPVENNTAQYIRNVCAWTEKDPAAVITKSGELVNGNYNKASVAPESKV
jgi:hypothetical protein